MNIRIILTIVLIVCAGTSLAQGKKESEMMIVLRKDIAGKTFTFGKWTDKGGTETRLTYLGSVTTKHGKTFKLVNAIWLWGQAGRATSRLYVYNDNDRYVGEYYMQMTYDLPVNMKNGKLCFRNTDNGCNKELITYINLKKGLPKRINIHCQKNEDTLLTEFTSDSGD